MREIDEIKDPKFDLIVHVRDEKSGEIIEVNSYIAHLMKTEGGTVTVFERPKGSGNCWDKFNKPAGRWLKEKKEGERYQPEAEHIAFIAPLTKDQKLRAEMFATEERNKQLERELALLRVEKAQNQATRGSAVKTETAKKPGA